VTIRDIMRSLVGSESFCIDRVFFQFRVHGPWVCMESYLAQCTMLGVCQHAHLTSSKVLADDAELPLEFGSTFALGTGDIMHSSSRCVQHSENGSDIDRAMVACGVQSHASEDINAAADGMCIGIDLVSGRYFAPSAISFRSVLDAIPYSLSDHLSLRVSPRQLAAF